MALFGFHASTINELKFSEISVGYTYLADWIGLPGMKYKKFFRNKGQLKKYVLSYNFRKDDKFQVLGDEISINRRFKADGSLLKEVQLKETINFKIKSEQKYLIDEWFTKYLFPLQNFLTLATNRRNSIINLHAYPSISKDENISPIQVFFRTDSEQITHSKDLSSYDLLFGLHDLNFKFGHVLTNWLKMNSNLKGVFDLFFIVQYFPDMYMPNQFLNIVLAIEGYHRGALNKDGKQKFKNENFPQKKYEKFKEQLIRNSPPEFKEFLRSKLQFNEIGLKKRLIALVDKTGRIIPNLIENKKSFAERVARIRNQLAHQSHGQNKSIPSTHEMFWMTQALMYLLRANLLTDMGISNDLGAKLFIRNQRFQFAKREIKKLSF